MQRHVTESGAALFILGTRTEDIVVRDTEYVPISDIFNHVTPEELHRFENEEYEGEAERERIRILTTKPRGRPKKQPDGSGFGVADDPPREAPVTHQTLPLRQSGYAALIGSNADGPRKRGRPKGWRKNAVSENAIVPSFNGPQPTGNVSVPETTPAASSHSEDAEVDQSRSQSVDSESEPDETAMDIQARTGVFSMVAASRLVPIDPETEPEPSRDVTPLLTDEELASARSSPERIVVDSEMSADELARSREDSEGDDSDVMFVDAPSHPNADDEIDEREDLLRQFTAHKAPDEREALLRQFAASKPPRGRSHVSDTTDASRASPVKTVQPAQPPTHQSRAEVPAPMHTPGRSLKRKSITPHFPSRIKRTASSKSRSKSNTTSKSPKSPLVVRTAQRPTNSQNIPPKSRGRPPSKPKPNLSRPISSHLAPKSQNIPVRPILSQLYSRLNAKPEQPSNGTRPIAISSTASSTSENDEESEASFSGVSPAAITSIDPRLVWKEGRRGVENSTSEDDDSDDEDDDEEGDDGDEDAEEEEEEVEGL